MTRKIAYVDCPWSWRVPIVGCLASFLTIGYYRCFGILMIAYKEERSFSHSILLTVYGLSYALNGVLAPFIQTLAAKWTSRRVAFLGGLLLFFCLSLQEVLHDMISFILLSGIGMGVGFSMIYATSIGLVGPTFRKHRAMATGIAFAGSSIGQMVFPWTATLLLDEYKLRGCVFIFGAVMLHASVGALVLPEKIVDGSSGEVIVHQTKKENDQTSKKAVGFSSVFRSALPFLPVVILVNFGYSNQHPILPSFGKEYGHSQEWISWLIFLQAIFDFGSRLSTGIFADCLSPRGKIGFMGIALLLQSAGLFLLIIRPSWAPSFVIYFISYGLAGGVYFVSWTVILASFVGHSAIPQAVAVSLAVADIVHLPGTFLLGLWRDSVSSYSVILLCLNGVMIASGLYSLVPLMLLLYRKERRSAEVDERIPLL